MKEKKLFCVMSESHRWCLAEAVSLTLTSPSGLRCGAMMSAIWQGKAAYMSNSSVLARPHFCWKSWRYVALTLWDFGKTWFLRMHQYFTLPVLRNAKRNTKNAEIVPLL